MKLLILLSFLNFAYAGIEDAPPSFKYKKSKAVFVDFTKAVYEISYDYKNAKAKVITTIDYTASEDGHIIFDSVSTPSKAYLDNKEIGTRLISTPQNITKVRVTDKVVTKGSHTLKIYTPLENGVAFTKKGVSSAFFIKDLTDRMFLERYVPSNYEYDQYQMTFKVKVTGSINRYDIFSNGIVTETSKNEFTVKYPEFYTSSSVFYHIVPKGKFKRLNFKFKSISGKLIPVKIYSITKLRNMFFAKKTVKILKELEADYGQWPHPALIVYGTKLKGGMEYVAGTVTSLASLDHELQHAYFAKGMIPANGNSGWMDEAIASWRDKGHKSTSTVNYETFNLGNHSVYTRKTDSDSYVKGRSFIAYLDYQLKSLGHKGMKDFLRGYFAKRKFTSVTTADFMADLKEYAKHDFQAAFDQYIFGSKMSVTEKSAKQSEGTNPHHGHMSDEDFNSLL